MEFMLGNKIFFYCHGTILLYTKKIFDNPSSMFLGVGAGYRVLDLRKDNKGHSITTSITFSLVPPLLNYEDKNNTFKRTITTDFLGGQVFATYYYNFHKNFALRVGLDFGVFSSKIYDEYIVYATREITSKDSQGVSITYGLSVGLAF